MSATEQDTLGDAFPREQARVRELLEDYLSIGPVGTFGAMMIRQTLARAEKAAVSGDIVEMLRAYNELKGCQ